MSEWRVRPVAELDATADKCHFLNVDYEPPIPLCGHAAADPECALFDGGHISDIEGLPLEFFDTTLIPLDSKE